MTLDDIIEELDGNNLLELAQEVAKREHVPLSDMLGRSRLQRFARARHAFWWALRHLGDRELSWHDIEDLTGFDHSTVIHGVRTHELRLAARTGPGVARAVGAVEEARVA